MNFIGVKGQADKMTRTAVQNFPLPKKVLNISFEHASRILVLVDPMPGERWTMERSSTSWAEP
jgi:hypothetical protein